MKRFAFPIAVLVAAVLLALALGGFFEPSPVQDVVLVPQAKEKAGYRVTVENIIARRKPGTETARLDLLLTIERSDGSPIEHDPYLAAEAWILKRPYRPDWVTEVPEDGLAVEAMRYALPPVGARGQVRRILTFEEVPAVWMAVDLNLLIAGSQPEADVVLSDIDLTGAQTRLPSGSKGATQVEVASVTRVLPDTRPPNEPTTLVTVQEKSRFIAPAKGWSRIGIALGRGRLVADGRAVGSLRHASSESSLTRAAYVFVVDPGVDPPEKAALEFVSTEAMLQDAIGLRFVGMTTLAPG